jgi:hypothetical protein
MEKFVSYVGMFIAYFCLVAALLMGNEWLWGCVLGGAMSGLGLLFME